MDHFKKNGKPALFLELACPDEFGFSRIVDVSLLQENNPELEGEQLKAKVNEIYNIVSGD